ncbi:HNH endonuclease signature motif containing protein, partial [Occultella glacieicola]|uniref:HNH endonuclease signature motif containing protein n=1 Tax=Occultella glacieicola TaxID=2518684 RepID=UPI0014047E0F
AAGTAAAGAAPVADPLPGLDPASPAEAPAQAPEPPTSTNETTTPTATPPAAADAAAGAESPAGPTEAPTQAPEPPTGHDGTTAPTAAPPATGAPTPTPATAPAAPATKDWAGLLTRGPATFTDNTGPVPRDLLERIINCSGEVYRIIFSPDNEVINHGRAHRLFTPSQRRALITRDRHCTAPDCTVPPERTESHHATRWWSNGGDTDLDQAALLCYYHHRWVHTHNITMTRQAGRWHFYRHDGTEIHPTETPWN